MTPGTRPARPSPARHGLACLVTLACAALAAPALASAQDPDSQPAFSLSSDRVFEPGGDTPPSVSLTFRRLDHLDFRVYRVRDTAAFFAGLREANLLGSPEYERGAGPDAHRADRGVEGAHGGPASRTSSASRSRGSTAGRAATRRRKSSHRPAPNGEVHAVRAGAAAQPRPGGRHLAGIAAEHARQRLPHASRST